MTSDLDVGERGGEADDPFLDRAYESLADPHRRALVATLRDAEPPVPMAALARRIAEREADASADVSDATVQDRYLSLYHVHLPKLAAVDAVEVDHDSNAVSPGENFDAVVSLLAE